MVWSGLPDPGPLLRTPGQGLWGQAGGAYLGLGDGAVEGVVLLVVQQAEVQRAQGGCGQRSAQVPPWPRLGEASLAPVRPDGPGLGRCHRSMAAATDGAPAVCQSLTHPPSPTRPREVTIFSPLSRVGAETQRGWGGHASPLSGPVCGRLSWAPSQGSSRPTGATASLDPVPQFPSPVRCHKDHMRGQRRRGWREAGPGPYTGLRLLCLSGLWGPRGGCEESAGSSHGCPQVSQRQ